MSPMWRSDDYPDAGFPRPVRAGHTARSYLDAVEEGGGGSGEGSDSEEEDDDDERAREAIGDENDDYDDDDVQRG